MSDLSERAERLLAAYAAEPSNENERSKGDRLAQFQELLTLATDAAAKASDRLAALDALEGYLRLHAALTKADNVLAFPQLGRHWNWPPAPESSGALPLVMSLAPALRPVASSPLLFWTKSEDRARIAALEAHALAGRWAFLPFGDLDASSHASLTAWLGLGSVTIFVPELERLPPETQTRLAEYLTVPPFAEAPLLIARSSSCKTELLANGGVARELLDRFSSRALDAAFDAHEIFERARAAMADGRIAARGASATDARGAHGDDPLSRIH